MYASSNQSSAIAGFAVVPSDTVSFVRRARSLYVGGGGNVALIGGDGVAVTFVAVPAGSILPIEATRVNATGTTATSMVGLV